MYVVCFYMDSYHARGSVIFKGSADEFFTMKHRVRTHTHPKLSQNYPELHGWVGGTGFLQMELVGSSVFCGGGEAGSGEAQ